MSNWVAVAIFPFAPSLAARRLAGAKMVAILPLLTTAGAWAYLRAGGASGVDATWAAATILRLFFGMIAGGAIASWIGARLIGRAALVSQVLGPAAVAAAWAPVVFLAFLWLGNAMDAAAASGLYAGIALLIWGIAAGFGIIGADEEPDPGRLLVASCLGFGGAILGAWAAHESPPGLWVRAVPAPVSEGGIEQGRFLLIRTNSAETGAAYLLLQDPDSREAVLVTRSAAGALTAVGEIRPDSRMFKKYNIAGRVFFQIGGPGSGSVALGEPTEKSSRNRTFYRIGGLPPPPWPPYN